MARPRSLIHGVGINDLPYNVAIRDEDNKQKLCPFYATWRRMLRRCYSKIDLEDHPSYLGCNVVDPWKTATVFKAWMETQNWKGLHLDKDILLEDNKTYSPESCVFVPQRLNKLLLSRELDRGEYLLGVSLRSNKNNWEFEKPFVAQITSVDCKVRCLGYFKTQEEAHKAWQRAKALEIQKAVDWYATEDCFNSKIADSLLARAWKLMYNADKGVVTNSL
jgi:hypothetical protein